LWIFVPTKKPHPTHLVGLPETSSFDVTFLFTELLCNATDGPFLARGLIRNHRLLAMRDKLPTLVEKLKTGNQCPGATTLTSKDREARDDLLKKSPNPNGLGSRRVWHKNNS
jgi:hypothetical protein